MMGRWAATGTGPDQTLAHVHVGVAWGGIAILAALAALGPRVIGRSVVPVVLVALTLIDTFFNVYLSRITIANPDDIARTKWERLDREHRTSLDLTRRGLDRVPVSRDENQNVDNGNLVTKVAAFQTYSAYMNRFHQAWTKAPSLVDMVVGADRIWFAPTSVVAETHLSDATFEAFRRRTVELGAMPVVLHRAEAMLRPTPAETAAPADNREVNQISQLPAATRITATLRSYRPNSLTFRVTIPESGYLLITDRWARAWRAVVDGHPAPLLGANFLFRALALKPGTHRIVLRYEPSWYPYLVFLSWGMLAAVASWTVVATIRARPTPKCVQELEDRSG
jgi:hypothetical protein